MVSELVDRDVTGVVEDFITLQGGSTTVLEDGFNFGTFQNVTIGNSDIPERRYRALQFQSKYQVFDRLGLYANYTYQLKNDGNFEGEGVNTPGSASVFGDYPEFFSPTRNYPNGRLNDYQQHKVRAWSIYTQPLGFLGSVDVSLLYRFDSAATYSLSSGSVPLTAIQRTLGAGYATTPNNQTLFYNTRGSEFFDSANLFDLGVQYEIPVFRSLRPYVKFDLFNMLNNDKLTSWNTTVSPNNAGARDGFGLPTEFVRGANFGRAASNASYPAARRYAIALGFRF